MPLLGAVHPGQLCSRENIRMLSRDRFVQAEEINLHSLNVPEFPTRVQKFQIVSFLRGGCCICGH